MQHCGKVLKGIFLVKCSSCCTVIQIHINPSTVMVITTINSCTFSPDIIDSILYLLKHYLGFPTI